MPGILVELNHIKLSRADRVVLDIDRFAVYDGEKIGLIGENGAGKTTLLRIIAGELAPDEGAVKRLSEPAYLTQMDGEAAQRAQITDAALIRRFRVPDASEARSGGEKTRRRIAAALSANRPLLLADEPTVDLDPSGVAQLEQALKAYPGAMILVSHDRALLDNLCTTICQLEDGHLTRFPGNYSAFLKERERRRQYEQGEYDAARAEQSRLRAAMQDKRERAEQVRKAPKRMGNSEARLHKRASTDTQKRIHEARKALASRLDQIEVKPRPRDDPSIRMKLGAPAPLTGKTALTVRDLKLTVPGRTLVERASFTLPTGSRTALVGPNGCGKTTLLRRIVSGDPQVRLSPGIKVGWFDQDQAQSLALDRTILENILPETEHDESTVRTVLARLGVRGDDVFKRVRVLSGGERVKVALARLLVSPANLLILDEPTNHLDIYVLDALESMLRDYAGTMLFVSHDRALVERVATRTLSFDGAALVMREGTAEERAATAQAPDQARLDRLTVELKLAALAGRIAQPRKGDDVVKLRDEYDGLARALRETAEK